MLRYWEHWLIVGGFPRSSSWQEPLRCWRFSSTSGRVFQSGENNGMRPTRRACSVLQFNFLSFSQCGGGENFHHLKVQRSNFPAKFYEALVGTDFGGGTAAQEPETGPSFNAECPLNLELWQIRHQRFCHASVDFRFPTLPKVQTDDLYCRSLLLVQQMWKLHPAFHGCGERKSRHLSGGDFAPG